MNNLKKMKHGIEILAMSRIIGIDPGLTGAIAIFNGGECTEIHDMPTAVKSVKRKRNRKGVLTDYPQLEVNAEDLYDILYHSAVSSGRRKQGNIFIEQVGPVYRQDKKQGTAAFQPLHATFTFGEGAGVIRGVCETLLGRACTHRVAPITWKKSHNLIGTEKDDARLQLLTYHDTFVTSFLTRKKDSGRADAILIAEYGHTVLNAPLKRGL